MVDPYEILGVQRDAEPEVVDAAYRALMKKYHPDRRTDVADTARSQAITAVYYRIKRGKSAMVQPDTAPVEYTSPANVALTVAAKPLTNLTLALLASALIVTAMVAIATS